MIFSMQKKFNEKGIYWDRTNRGWMKTVVGLDKTKKNGYSLIGEFVNAGVRKGDYEPGIYLNCNKGERGIVYQLIRVTDDADVELIQSLENPGRDWAIEFWEAIEANLGPDTLSPSYPDKFLNRLHLNAYLYHAGIIDMGSHMIEENMTKDGMMDERTFEVPKELAKYQDHLRCLSKVIFSKKYDPLKTVYEPIKDVNDLLNLNFLESLRPDNKALGISFSVRTSEKYYKRQMLIIMTVKGGELCVRWVNHLL